MPIERTSFDWEIQAGSRGGGLNVRIHVTATDSDTGERFRQNRGAEIVPLPSDQDATGYGTRIATELEALGIPTARATKIAAAFAAPLWNAAQ